MPHEMMVTWCANLKHDSLNWEGVYDSYTMYKSKICSPFKRNAQKLQLRNLHLNWISLHCVSDDMAGRSSGTFYGGEVTIWLFRADPNPIPIVHTDARISSRCLGFHVRLNTAFPLSLRPLRLPHRLCFSCLISDYCLGKKSDDV